MTGLVIGITGANGFLGRPLSRRLTAAGHTVIPIPRQLGALPMVDAVIHLAGESIAGFWTARRKRRIFESRVEGTRRLVERMVELDRRPRVFISASAAGFYGHRPGEVLTEESSNGRGFRARVCAAWEAEARAAEALGIRTVIPRFGTILDPSGGYLGKLMPLYRRGLCFVIGRASDRFPWISLEDAIRFIERSLADPSIRGPVNVVAPGTATQGEFARAIAAWLGRHVLGRLPRTALRLALGELATAFTDSQDVRPAEAIRRGFEFLHPTLEQALEA